MATAEHLYGQVGALGGSKAVPAAPGAHGYSSSGHSDASQHLNGTNNSNSTSTSRQGSLETPDTEVPAMLVPAAAAALPAAGHMPHAPSYAPSHAPLTVAEQTPQASAGVERSATSALPVSELPAATAAVQALAAPAAPTPHIQIGVVEHAAAATVPDAAGAAVETSLPALSPLTAPDPAEGPEVHAEYQAYAARFNAGDTLAQRWHRLAQKGLLDDIRADYEEWQHDLMLQQLQAQIQASNKGRKRRQAEESEPDADAPRQTRNRRAPSNLQDYAVDAPTAPGGVAASGMQPGSAAAMQPGGNQVHGGGGSDDAAYSEEQELEQQHLMQAAAARGVRGSQHHHQQQQQRGGRGGRGADRPPSAAVAQHQQGAGCVQQQEQWGHWPVQQQQQQQQGMMAGAAAAAAGLPAGLSPELMAQLFQMGTAMGAALQQQQHAGGAGAAGAAAGGPPSAAAMAAAMEACARMWGNDPAALAQQMGALSQQAQQ